LKKLLAISGSPVKWTT